MKLAALITAVFLWAGSAFAEIEPGSRFEPGTEPWQQLPGIELAESISQITGTAISPMLGMSSVGAWKYYRTPASDRNRLPWFCHPFVWSTGFVLLGLCLLKDVVGTGAPAVLKKPLDLAELFENKLSAIIASSAFVPIIATELARHNQTSVTAPSAAVLSEMHFAAVPFLANASSTLVMVLAVGLATIGFFLVWLSCHAINVLIALSPFTTVDAALKLLKAGLLFLVTATAFVNPWIGLAVCLGIILLAGLLAPWAFRFTLFGTLFATDTFRFRILGRRQPRTDLATPRVFTSRKFSGLPVRMLGRLARTADGQLVFRYRPWLLLPACQAPLPSGNYTLSKGLLCPVVLQNEHGESRSRSLLTLLPRYCSHETAIAEHLVIGDVQDGGIHKGFKAMTSWLTDMLGMSRNRLVSKSNNAPQVGHV